MLVMSKRKQNQAKNKVLSEKREKLVIFSWKNIYCTTFTIMIKKKSKHKLKFVVFST